MSSIYQLKIIVRDIKPLIWRRLQVRSEMTLAQLHDALQILMGWSNDYLHCFSLHGQSYRICRPEAPEGKDANLVTLEALKLQQGEVLQYEYNFRVPWQLDIRLESIVTEQAQRVYPYLVSGQRHGPNETLWGPEDYLAHREWHKNNPPIKALNCIATAVLHNKTSILRDDDFDTAMEHFSFYYRYTAIKLDLSSLRNKLVALQ